MFARVRQFFKTYLSDLRLEAAIANGERYLTAQTELATRLETAIAKVEDRRTKELMVALWDLMTVRNRQVSEWIEHLKRLQFMRDTFEVDVDYEQLDLVNVNQMIDNAYANVQQALRAELKT